MKSGLFRQTHRGAFFKPLADEVKLPRYRQESCTEDYNKALNAWDSLLKPHRRAPDQHKTNIDVAYGDGRGKQLEVIAKASRDIKLLEPVAGLASDQLAWPAPFALEMQTCGFLTLRGSLPCTSSHYVTNWPLISETYIAIMMAQHRACENDVKNDSSCR